MLQKFASSAFVAGTLLTALMPAVGLARDHGGDSGGGGRSSSSGRSARSSGNSRQSFSGGGGRNSAPRGGGQSFVSPRGSEGRRGFSGGSSYYSRGYVAPRSYGRSVYRGYYGGGVYLGYGAPYGYAYDPGYAYGPGYAPAYPYDPGYSAGYSNGPAPAQQTCAPGSYDQYGNLIPNPNCYSNQQQYPPQQQQQQPYYDPNQQQYPQQQYQQQPQQNYAPNQPQPYSR
jgi:hypothetical protein